VSLGIGILQVAIACVLIAASRLDQRPSATIALAKKEQSVVAEFPFIDVHTHLDPTDTERSIGRAVQAVQAENEAGVLFLPPPLPPDSKNPYDYEVLRSATSGHGSKLAFLGGGGTLNVMIQQAVRNEWVTPELVKRFRAQAEEIVREDAVGFGEMAAEHFATGAGTYYEYAPPDHPLFLLLADISAEHGGIPIDLHMEAVPHVMKLPDGFASPPNPPQLHPNIEGFERLLAHNRGAKIVWAHAGWDNTGFRTPELMRRLLGAHPNLYMEIKIDPAAPGKNSPLEDGRAGAIKPQWLRLFQDFSDRFVIGSDQHYPEPAATVQRWQPVVLLLNQLPPDLRRKIGQDNAVSIYHLTVTTAAHN
jgi:predicted TIM-barrel fold metal-dependent hydrolase